MLKFETTTEAIMWMTLYEASIHCQAGSSTLVTNIAATAVTLADYGIEELRRRGGVPKEKV